MGTQWLTTMKPSFQTAWLALSPKETHHDILLKIFVVPANTSSPLLTTFDSRYWTILEREAMTTGQALTA